MFSTLEHCKFTSVTKEKAAAPERELMDQLLKGSIEMVERAKRFNLFHFFGLDCDWT